MIMPSLTNTEKIVAEYFLQPKSISKESAIGNNAELTNISDFAVFSPASPEPILGKNGTARLIKLALIDCLYATIVNMTGEASTNSMKKTLSATDRLHR